MAIVKPTDKEWQHVERKIGEMFEKRLKYANNWAHYGHTVADLEQIMFEEVYPTAIREQVQIWGERYFNQYNQIRVEIAGTYYQLTFIKMYVPDKMVHYGAENKLKNPTLVDVVKKRNAAIAKVEADQEAFTEKVKGLWTKAPSINAIVKLWHPILELLSPDVQNRLNKKVERRSLSKTMDTAAITELSTDYLKSKVGK